MASEKLNSTHEDENMTVTSIQGSTWSLNSFRDATQFIKQQDGRIYNTLNELYFLPADSTEWDRLDKEHTALYLALEGLYPCPQVVREVLKPSPGVSKDILDLGCGTGVWAIEMAKEFGHANVIGVDLVPVPLDNASIPQNVRMEGDDINMGLSHFYDRFDLVHLRTIETGVRDYEATLREAEKCLKPGGILIAIEPSPDLLAEDQKGLLPMASDDIPDGSWLRRALYEVRCCGVAMVGDGYLDQTILEKGLWHHKELDSATCGAGDIYIPIGPWPNSMDFDHNTRLKFCGALQRQSVLGVDHSFYLRMKKSNIPHEVIKDWMMRVEEELSQIKHKSWMRFRTIWGRKRLAEGLPAPSLSVPDIYIPSDAQRKAMVVEDGDLQRQMAMAKEPPLVDVYHTQEELKKRAAAREATRGLYPPPLVLKYNSVPS